MTPLKLISEFWNQLLRWTYCTLTFRGMSACPIRSLLCLPTEANSLTSIFIPFIPFTSFIFFIFSRAVSSGSKSLERKITLLKCFLFGKLLFFYEKIKSVMHYSLLQKLCWNAVIKCLFFGCIMSTIRIYSSVSKGLDVSINLLNYADNITNSMEQSSSGQPGSLSAIWRIPCLVWRPEVHVHVHMNLFKDQTNPFFILTVFI